MSKINRKLKGVTAGKLARTLHLERWVQNMKGGLSLNLNAWKQKVMHFWLTPHRIFQPLPQLLKAEIIMPWIRLTETLKQGLSRLHNILVAWIQMIKPLLRYSIANQTKMVLDSLEMSLNQIFIQFTLEWKSNHKWWPNDVHTINQQHQQQNHFKMQVQT